MVIKLREKTVGIAAVSAGLVICATLFFTFPKGWYEVPFLAGGSLHPAILFEEGAKAAVKTQDELDGLKDSERFQRPSKLTAFPNSYSFSDFEKESETQPLTTSQFQTPEQVILAYYGILRNAANLQGYSGGCGTVGDTCAPYPYAYELFTEETRKKITLRQFENSFRGIGHTTLLRVLPAYAPAGTPENRSYFMTEVELITGNPQDAADGYGKRDTNFTYYYGLISTEQTADRHFLISQIDYIPEDFLCAPMHGWSYDAISIVQIVYQENLKMIDRITKSEVHDGLLSFYASGQGNEYRFDFVRLTNGYDILLHEYRMENRDWKEVNLLSGAWENLKFSASNPSLHSKLP